MPPLPLRPAVLLLFLACPAPAAILPWPLLSLLSDPAQSPASDHFGALALSGTGLCALVAAPGCGVGCAAGTVYALSRPSPGSPWAGTSPPPALPIPTGATAAGTGLALPASCGVAAFVGAPNTALSQGAVYTYAPCTTEPSGWCRMATLTVVDAGLPTFGAAVAANGGGWGIAVGAPNAGAANGAGSTWFCTAAGLAPNASAWTCEHLPPPPSAAQGDWLGTAVFLSDNAQLLVSTAPYRASQGAVFVYARAAGGAAGGGGWAVAATLDPSPPPCSLAGSNRNFGYSLSGSSDGGVLLVGSPLGGSQYGAATVFDRNAAGGGYSCTAVLRPGAKVLGDSVGSGVALSGDGNTAFVSGIRTVHVFVRAGVGGAWVESGALQSPNQAAYNEDYGRRVATSRSGLAGLVGAPGTLSAASTYAGYAALFDASNITPSGTSSGTGSATPTPSGTRSGTGSASRTLSDTASGTPSRSGTASASAVTRTPSPSPTPSGTGTASAGASASGSDSSTGTPSATATPSGSTSDSETATVSPTPGGALPSDTATPCATPTSSAAPPAAASPGTSAAASPSATLSRGGAPPSQTSGGGAAALAGGAASALTPGATAGVVVGTLLLLLAVAAGMALFGGCSAMRARRAAAAKLGGAPAHPASAAVMLSPLHGAQLHALRAGPAPPEAAAGGEELPHGWLRHSDETGDVWFTDPAGQPHWTKPALV